MFEKIKKIFRKEKDKMSTLDDVRKAYEDLSEDDKKAFHQSIADRIHESIGEQEKDDGTKDTQTAADREHEALGEEHAEGKGDVEKLHETDKGEVEHEKEQEAKHEESEKTDEVQDDALKMINARLEALEAKIEKIAGADKLDDARAKYGLSPKGTSEPAAKSYSDADINKLLG